MDVREEENGWNGLEVTVSVSTPLYSDEEFILVIVLVLVIMEIEVDDERK